MGSIGPTGETGERGKTGDHGQRGETGDIGDRGPTGRIGDTGTQGIQGRPGHIGDPGVAGEAGIQGVQGEPGRRGLRGQPLTWVQALAMFLLITVIGLSLAVALERQQSRLARQQAVLAEQQAEIQRNAAVIAENRYQGCLNGVRIIEKFNAQMQELADIERRNTDDPLAKERIQAYEKGITPLPNAPCRR